MRWLRVLFQAYWRSVRGRCMIHGVPMIPTDGSRGFATHNLACPVCDPDFQDRVLAPWR